MFSALTLPRCAKASSSARCLVATCAEASKCCSLQPPQVPKCGHRGVTRSALSRPSATMLACSQLFLRRDTETRTFSPGKAPSMNTTLPSLLCATPWPSRSSDSTVSHSFSVVMAGDYPVDWPWRPQPALRHCYTGVARREPAVRGAAEGADRVQPGPIERSGKVDWQT